MNMKNNQSYNKNGALTLLAVGFVDDNSKFKFSFKEHAHILGDDESFLPKNF